MREKEHLKKRYAAIFSSCGMILILGGVTMLTPLIGLPATREQASHVPAFLFPAACLVALGLLLRRTFRSDAIASLTIQEGGVIVLCGWTLVILFSAWPFISILEIPFSRALFESVSGWTTTGLSVIDVNQAPPLILLWRSITQLVGGAGLAVLMMSAVVGPTGAGISSAEGRSEQLVPQVKQSARLVLAMYGCYAVGGTMAYRAAGMTLFDAVNHAFTAVSTGGFSTRTESIGFWDSPAVEGVSIVLMLLGSLSFVTAWFLWRGKFYTVVRNGEIRLLALILPLCVTGIFVFTCRELYANLEKGVRVALFQTVSAVTTTGFSTVGYGEWNGFGILMLIGLMLVGGGTCSTAGGIKQFRIHLLFKLVRWEVRRALLPQSTVMEMPVWEGEHRRFVDDTRIRQVTVFVFLYLTALAMGTLLLCACGFRLCDALFEMASATGTVGFSVQVTSAAMPNAALWTEILAMFLGRLEFMVVLVSLLKLGRDAQAASTGVWKRE